MQNAFQTESEAFFSSLEVFNHFRATLLLNITFSTMYIHEYDAGEQVSHFYFLFKFITLIVSLIV